MLTVRSCARARALWVRSPFDECNVWGYAVLPEVDISCRTCSHADQIIRLLSPQPTWSSRLRWRLIFTTGMVCSSPEASPRQFQARRNGVVKAALLGQSGPDIQEGAACGEEAGDEELGLRPLSRHGGRSPVDTAFFAN